MIGESGVFRESERAGVPVRSVARPLYSSFCRRTQHRY